MKLAISRLFIVALVFKAGLFSLTAQITLAPSFVFIDEKTGVGNLYVSNKGTVPQEVTLSFSFGYPGSDSSGNLVMNYEDTSAFRQFGLDPMVRAFPKNFSLAAGEQRTVRIQVIPGKRSKEGFFYTRLKVLGKPETPEVAKEEKDKISTRISFNFEQVTAVFYHKGKVSTGLELKKLEVVQQEKLLVVKPHLTRTGNSPFLGSMFAKLIDEKGVVVAEAQSTTTAYFDVIRRIDVNVENVIPGTYTLELRFETRRNDMMSGDLVQAPPLVTEMKVEVK